MTFRSRRPFALLLALAALATASSCLAPDAVPADASGGGNAGGSSAGGSSGSSAGSTGNPTSTGGGPVSTDLAWAHSYGVPQDFDLRALGVAATADGHALLAGEFVGSISFGALPPLPNTAAHDAFLASFAPDGTPEWSIAFAGFGEQRAYRAFPTADGGVVVGGTFDQTLMYGSADHGAMPQGQDGFVASLAADRSLRWVVLVHGPGNQAVHDIAPAPDGGVIVAGWFAEALHIGGLDGASAQSNRDFFVAKIGADGAPAWATSLAGDPADLPAEQPSIVVGAALDSTLRVAGTFVGTLSFDKDVSATGDRDAFFGALSADGKPLWGRAIGAPTRQQRASCLAVTAQGHTLLAGDLLGDVAFPGGAVLKSDGDGPDAFLADIDDKGTFVWGRRYGSKADDHGGPVAVGSGGHTLLAGRFRGAISFGSDASYLNSDASSPSDDIFFADLAPDRSPARSFAFGKAQSQVPTAIAVDPAGDVFLAGYFDGVVDFGAGDLDAQAGSDIFIAKFGK